MRFVCQGYVTNDWSIANTLLLEVLAYVTGLLLSACVSFCVGLYYVSCLPIFAATSAGTLGSSARCMGIGVASGG